MGVRYTPTMVDPAKRKATALLALGGAMAIWSGMPVILKHFTGYLDPWTLMCMRFILASLFWLPLLTYHHTQKVLDRSLARAALAPAMVLCGAHILWTYAPYYNQANILMFIGRTAFLFSTFFSLLVLPSERFRFSRKLFWVGFMVTVTGLAAMFITAREGKGTSVTGLLIMLGVSLCWGLYGILIKRNLGAYPPRVCFSIIVVYLLPVFLVLMFLKGDVGLLRALSAGNWALLLVSSVLPLALGHVLSYTAIQVFGPMVTEGAYNSIPFLSMVIALVVLGEQLTGMQWAGGLAIVAGSVCLLLTKRAR